MKDTDVSVWMPCWQTDIHYGPTATGSTVCRVQMLWFRREHVSGDMSKFFKEFSPQTGYTQTEDTDYEIYFECGEKDLSASCGSCPKKCVALPDGLSSCVRQTDKSVVQCEVAQYGNSL